MPDLFEIVACGSPHGVFKICKQFANTNGNPTHRHCLHASNDRDVKELDNVKLHKILKFRKGNQHNTLEPLFLT